MLKIIILTFMLITSLFANIGQIVAIKGKISVNEKIVNVGYFLNKGDSVVSTSESRAQIELIDKTIITIGSNSKLNIDDYVYDETTPSNNKASFGFMEGSFKSITGKIGKLNKERFKLKTKSASIGIRGTTIVGNQEFIACTDGEISVTANGVTVNVKKQEVTKTEEGKAPTPAAPLTKESLNVVNKSLEDKEDKEKEKNNDNNNSDKETKKNKSLEKNPEIPKVEQKNTTLILSVNKTSLKEGESITYTVTSILAPTRNLTVTLSNGKTIAIKAGKTSGSVTYTPREDDSYINGDKNLNVTITSFSSNIFDDVINDTTVKSTLTDNEIEKVDTNTYKISSQNIYFRNDLPNQDVTSSSTFPLVYFSRGSTNTSETDAATLLNGEITSSSYNTGESPDKAFDQDTSNNSNWAGSKTNAFIQYSFSESTVINKYTITPRPENLSQAPKIWNFVASNDGVNWTTLDSQSLSSNWTEPITFNLNNNTSYKIYKINISESFDTNWVGISEIDLIKAQTPEYVKFGY